MSNFGAGGKDMRSSYSSSVFSFSSSYLSFQSSQTSLLSSQNASGGSSRSLLSSISSYSWVCAGVAEPGGTYIAADAGSASANGTYVEYSTSDGVTSYYYEGGSCYLYRYDDGVDKWWIIGTVHGQVIGGDQTLYDMASSGATPPLGAWSTTYGFGDFPDPTLSTV